MDQVEDLSVASPATVSRVGIIYMEPRGLGLDALCQTWLANLPSTLPQDITVQFSALFDTYLCSGMVFMQSPKIWLLEQPNASIKSSMEKRMARVAYGCRLPHAASRPLCPGNQSEVRAWYIYVLFEYTIAENEHTRPTCQRLT